MKKKKLIALTSLCVILVLMLGLLPAYAAETGTPISEPSSQSALSLASSSVSEPVPSVPEAPTSATPTIYTLTIRYLAEGSPDEPALAPAYTAQLEEGQAYSVPSPTLEGYSALIETVEGQMPGHDMDIDVAYSQNAPALLPETPEAQEADPASTENRQLIIHYFYLDDGSAIGGSVAAAPFYGKYLAHETYSVPSPIVAGYVPDTAIVAGTMGSADLLLDVWYSKADQTAYTVQHLLENMSGSFVPSATYPDQTLSGTTGSLTQATAHYIPGYTAGAVAQTPIAANGSTQVVIQYTRLTNYVYFSNEGKVYIDPIELKFEQSAPLPSVPAVNGHTFAGWYLDATFTQPFTDATITMGASDITLYSKWSSQQAAFRVATWIEDANSPGTYLYSEIESLAWATGPVGEMTQVSESDLVAAPSQYQFIRADNVRIQADGSAIVNVYYDRNTYTVSFYRGFVYNQWDPNAWVSSIETTPFKTLTAKYGADVSAEWSQMGDNFFSYRWTSRNTDPWGNWTTGFKTQPGANYNFYGVPNTGAHNYHLHYYFELLDQTSAVYDVVDTAGIKYADDPTQLERFPYADHTVTIQGPTNSKFLGFYLPATNYYRQFDQNSSITEHHGGYLYRRSTTTIDFNTLRGSAAPARITALYETDIVAQTPADPTKPGHSFGGWFTNETYQGQPFAFTLMPGKNVILYAKWSKDIFSVNFNLNYPDAGIPPQAQEIGYNEAAEPPQTPVRLGYAFVGWYENAQGTGSRYVFDKPVSADVTLYAVWSNENVGYTVRYTKQDNNQPFAAPKETTGRAGATVTETAFVDNTQKYVPDSASKSLYLGADAVQNIVEFLYKPFTTLSYKVEYRYAAGGGLIPQDILGTANPKIVENGEFARVVELYAPLAGYVPDSYQKAKTLSYEVTPADIQDNRIVFYYSTNSGVEYTVEHYKENPSATSLAEKYPILPDLSQVFRAPVGNTVGGIPQSFTGYSYNPTQSAQTASGTVSNSPPLVLKLYYDSNRYTVKFNTQGGSAVFPVENILHGSVIASQKPTDPTLAGKNFLGWYKEPTGIHLWNFSADAVTANITLYAKWASLYGVVYDANGGIGSQQDLTLYPSGERVVVKGAGGVSRDGYLFLGWALGRTTYTKGQTFIINGNTVLVAQWQEVSTQSSSSLPITSTSSETQPPSSSAIAPTASSSVVPSSSSLAPSASSQSSVSSSAPAFSTPPDVPPPTDPEGTDAGGGNTPDGGGATIGAAAPVQTLGDLIEQLRDGNVPLGNITSSGSWSLLNLLVALACLAVSVVMAIALLVSRVQKKQAAQQQNPPEKSNAKRGWFRLRIAAILAGLLPIVFFLLFENISLPVAWINQWTPLLSVLAVVALALFLLSSLRIGGRKKTKQADALA